jgi:hypothetical protein
MRAVCIAAFLTAPATANASGHVLLGGWYDNAIGSVDSNGSDPRPNLVANTETIPLDEQ